MKELVKTIIRTFSLIITFPFALICNVTKNDNLFVAFGQLISIVPGKSGSFLRVGFYRQMLEKCSKDIFIGFGTYFSQKKVMVGNGVYIGAFCILGMVELNDHVTIGSGVHILSGKQQHNYRAIGLPIQQQGGRFEQVTIGRNTWIGSCAVILASIGIHNVIGAGTVVVKEIDDYEIWVGNPAQCKGQIEHFE